jgi:hypothetical protein
MHTAQTILGSEFATYYGKNARLELTTSPGEIAGTYRCQVYDPVRMERVYRSTSDLYLADAKSEASREAERYAGPSAQRLSWQPELFIGEEA